MPVSDYVRIFDTTLRDGEQSPGASMTSSEKLEVARGLARLGVDIIEAGFAAASPDDLAAVAQIARVVGQDGESTPSGEPPSICSLARCNRKDIEKAWEAVQSAARPRIHTFLATSDIHLEHKLRMTRDEALSAVRENVSFARSLCEDVEFSPEDACRTDPAFLHQVLAVAIEAGATTLNIPDTVGFTMPGEYRERIKGIMENVPGVEDVTVSTHCHNDLGLATANSLAAIEAGARQVEVAMNGIGERAGNTALEEVVMALATRGDHYGGLRTGIDTTQLLRTSKLVSSITGMTVQPNKAVVGANAFAHEAGIHQDGMLKHQATYEIMRPESVGAGKTRLVLGKHSGRHAVKTRLAELGYSLEGEALDVAFASYKKLADRKKVITDADLEAIVADQLCRPEEIFSLDGVQVACGTIGMPTATVRVREPGGELRVCAAVGDGPVDALFKAIREALHFELPLLEFSVQSVTEGIDALGEVTVRLAGDETHGLNPQSEEGYLRTYVGHGTDTDIVVASAKAYLAALNKALVVHRGSPMSSEAPMGGLPV